MEQNGIIRAEQGVNWDSQETIKVLMETVAQGLSPAEFGMFVEICKGTRLNPFKREIWAIKGKDYTNKRGELVRGKVQIMTGINGFYEIANRDPNFDGVENGFVGPGGEYLPQTYPKNDFIGAWSRVYRKDRKIPFEAVAMLSEYDKSVTEQYYTDGGTWKKLKRVMIVKCADSIALRKAFPQVLNGLNTDAELPSKEALDGRAEIEAEAQNPAQPAQKASCIYDLNKLAIEHRDSAVALLKKAGATTEDELLLYWESPVEIKKLANYKVEA